MKTLTSLFFCFVSFGVLQAQQDLALPGIVVEQNSKYKTGKTVYLSNAEIKSAGAAPQRSDSNGKFTLLFADRPGGDIARIFASKSGYDVVNEEELKQASVVGRLQPLKVVMCTAGQLYDNQVAYYKIAKDAGRATFERKIAVLQNEGREKDRLMAELQLQFNQEVKTAEEAKTLLEKQLQTAELQAKELADRWVTVNLDDESPAYQRAFTAFQAKDLELAKAILDSVDFEQRLHLNNSEKAKEEALRDTLEKNILRRETEMQQDVNMCLFKARLHILDYEFAAAERLYDLAVQYDKWSAEVAFEAATFLQEQNQFKKAEDYYKKALALSKAPASTSNILNNLGVLLMRYRDLSGAKTALEEALQITRKLVEENPNAHLPKLALILTNLGILTNGSDELESAINYYVEAWKIYDKLGEQDADSFLPEMAFISNSLGDLRRDNNEMESAQKYYHQALLINRLLAEENPDEYLGEVARTLNNYGNLLGENQDMAGAKIKFEEALQIYRELAEKNPDAYLPEMAMNLNDLGNLLKANGDKAEAKTALEEALQIRRKLAEKNPEIHLPEVAASLNNLGNLLKADDDDLPGAKAAYKEALQIRREMAEKNPDLHLPDLALALNNYGNFQNNNYDMFGAANSYDEALQIRRKLAEKKPDIYLPEVAITLNNLGNLMGAYYEFPGAKKAFEEALQIRIQFAEKNPMAYNLDVAATEINLCLLYTSMLESSDDKALKKEGLKLLKDAEKRLAIYPESNRRVINLKGYITRLGSFYGN